MKCLSKRVLALLLSVALITGAIVTAGTLTASAQETVEKTWTPPAVAELPGEIGGPGYTDIVGIRFLKTDTIPAGGAVGIAGLLFTPEEDVKVTLNIRYKIEGTSTKGQRLAYWYCGNPGISLAEISQANYDSAEKDEEGYAIAQTGEFTIPAGSQYDTVLMLDNNFDATLVIADVWLEAVPTPPVEEPDESVPAESTEPTEPATPERVKDWTGEEIYAAKMSGVIEPLYGGEKGGKVHSYVSSQPAGENIGNLITGAFSDGSLPLGNYAFEFLVKTEQWFDENLFEVEIYKHSGETATLAAEKTFTKAEDWDPANKNPDQYAKFRLPFSVTEADASVEKWEARLSAFNATNLTVNSIKLVALNDSEYDFTLTEWTGEAIATDENIQHDTGSANTTTGWKAEADTDAAGKMVYGITEDLEEGSYAALVLVRFSGISAAQESDELLNIQVLKDGSVVAQKSITTYDWQQSSTKNGVAAFRVPFQVTADTAGTYEICVNYTAVVDAYVNGASFLVFGEDPNPSSDASSSAPDSSTEPSQPDSSSSDTSSGTDPDPDPGDYQYGDISMDGAIDPVDALMVLQAYTDVIEVTDIEVKLGDVDGTLNGLDPVDAMLILQKYVGSLDQFPIESGEVEENYPTVPPVQEVKPNLPAELYYTGGDFETAETVYLINGELLPIPEAAMIQSLQGIVTQKTGQGQIFMRLDTTDDLWIQEMEDNYGITFVEKQDPWELVDMFKEYITDSKYVHYVTYEADGISWEQNSINIASTIAGQEGYLMVEERLVSQAEAHGLTMGDDGVNYEYIDILDKYKDTLNKDVLVSLDPITYYARDLGIALGSMFYREQNPGDTFTDILANMNPYGVVLGWHYDEFTGVRMGAQYTISTIPSDSSRNWTVTSGLQHTQFTQTPNKQYEVKDANDKHYVTIMFSDGDNLGYIEHSFSTSKQWYGSPNRGAVPVNWTLSAASLEFTPQAVNYLFNNATINDYFIAGFSGLGYMYPNEYGILDDDGQRVTDEVRTNNLKNYFQRAGSYMSNMNMKYVRLFEEGQPVSSGRWESNIDERSRQILLDTYGSADGIEGGFIYCYYFMGLHKTSHFAVEADFPQYNGGVYWCNDKPFIYCRDWLRQDNPTRSEVVEGISSVAYRTNQQLRDPSVIEGYSAIDVGCWQYSYDDIVALVSMFDEDVIAVTADEFMTMIKENVEHETKVILDQEGQLDYSNMPLYQDAVELDLDNARVKIATTQTSFDFDTVTEGTQGWVPWVRGGGLDSAAYGNVGAEEEDGDYGISLSGTHNGTPSMISNAMVYNKITLPASAQNLTISGCGELADVRVKVMDADENITIVSDWTRWGGDNETFAEKDIDISEFAGETVTIYIEFSDGNSNGCIFKISAIDIA